MYPSNSDTVDNSDGDNNLQMRPTNTPPNTSNPSHSSSPSCPALFVVDDNSTSEDSPIHPTNIPTKPMPSTITTPASHIQVPVTLSAITNDLTNDTPEQQRRRNSSIAKLLGGHPLHNQQYEEINQQILDDQTAQNIPNNGDNGTDNGIQRSRSSITRTLLMNAERNNNTKLSTKGQTSSGPFSKDFEYLIRQELDTEHTSSTLQRNGSSPSVFQNVNSSTNANRQSPTQPRLKRKRSIPKLSLTTTSNKISTNTAPFALQDPFELESSSTNTIPPAQRTRHHHNELPRFDKPNRSRHPNQQYSLPVNNLATNPSSFPYHKMNMNSAMYNQFSIHHEPVHPSNGSAPCNCPHYPSSNKLTLPSPVSSLSSASIITHNKNNTTGTSSRKTKSLLIRPELYDTSRQRSYSNISNPSDSSLVTSSEPNVPLKKRLLQSYKNEQQPTSSL